MNLKTKTPPRVLEQIEDHFRFTFVHGDDPSPETKTWDWRDRRIASFKNPPQVSSEREKTTIAGTLENGATFEYNVEISHRGLSFWGKINESRSEKYPTSLTIAFYSPNFIPNVTNMSLKEIEPLVGTGKMYLDPLESKRQQLDMMDKWTDIMGKARGMTGIQSNQPNLWVLLLGRIKSKLLQQVLAECIFT